MMTTPADRSHLATERRNPRSAGLHAKPVDEVVHLLLSENAAAFAAAVAAGPAIAAVVAAALPGFARGGRIIQLGAGTSGRLAVLDASEAPPTFCVGPDRVIGIIAGGDQSLRQPSEGAEDDPAGAIAELQRLAPGADDLVIGIAAGGTTPYVRGALAWCAALATPPVTTLMTCVDVPAPDGCTHRILLDSGPELLTGSTRLKAGTATKLALNAISTALMVGIGKCHDNLMVDVRASNAKLRDRAARIIRDLTGLPREACFPLLDAAGGSAKVAVVMHRRHADRSQAERLLAQAGGRLSQII